MQFETFLKKLQTKGFGTSERDTSKKFRLIVEQIEEIRKAGDSIRIPGLGTLKTKKTKPRKYIIAGKPFEVGPKQRLVFKPTETRVDVP